MITCLVGREVCVQGYDMTSPDNDIELFRDPSSVRHCNEETDATMDVFPESILYVVRALSDICLAMLVMRLREGVTISI